MIPECCSKKCTILSDLNKLKVLLQLSQIESNAIAVASPEFLSMNGSLKNLPCHDIRD